MGQRLVCYLLFGPQTNRIGLFYFSINTAAEDLSTTTETLRGALLKVAESFGWSFDAVARVFYIPSWWRWNSPDHEKVLRGNLKDLSELPPCGLVDALSTNLTYLKPELLECFVKAVAIALPKASPSQYQEPFSNRKQKHAGEYSTSPRPGDQFHNVAHLGVSPLDPQQDCAIRDGVRVHG